ncbi:MAG: hypothetical protein ACOCUV_03390 [bacterium]
MKSKITLTKALLLVILLATFTFVMAQSEQPGSTEPCVHVFIDKECPDCQTIQDFLDSSEFEDIHLEYHDISNESEKEIYESFKDQYGIESAGYTSLFIGNNYLIGQDAIRGNIENLIEDCKESGCPCPAEKIKGISPSIPKGDYKPEKEEILDIPLVGKVNLAGMPLFVMTFLIAFIDGFNPCSVWVLTFLMGIVVYSGSRKKIGIIGLTFLLVTATAYGAFILGLLNVFAYIGYLFWIKVLVGLLAFIFAVVNIKDYFWYKKGISFTISDKYKPSIFKKVRKVMDPSQSLPSMVFATVVMALGIVLVELPCTAGFPLIWSNIMAQNNVPMAQFIPLFLLYILIYLLIELVIFFGVLISLRASRFEEKHGRVLKLVGGIIMLVLAITIIFFPDAMNTVTGSLYVFGIAGAASSLIIWLHRKILPRFGIRIGSEFQEHKEIEGDKDGNTK